MRFMQMESTTFLVREKGLDPKAFRIQATCLVCRGYIREQIERVFIPFCPATEKHNRAIGVFRHADIRSRDEGPWLDTGCHGVATEALAVPHDDDITPRPDYIGPVILLHRVRETRPIKCAIAQQDHLRPCRYPLLDLCEQGQMPLLGKMSLLARAHQPCNRQCAAFVDHMQHPGDTPTPYDTAISHQDQRLQRQMPQQDFGERDKIPFLRDMVVPKPSGKAFDTALGLSPIGHVRGNFGQLRALAPHDTTNERREGGQVPGDGTCRLARISLCEGVSYGTIPAEVVTHGMLLLDWSRFPESIR